MYDSPEARHGRGKFRRGKGEYNTMHRIPIIPQSSILLGTKFYDMCKLPNQLELPNIAVEQGELDTDS